MAEEGRGGASKLPGVPSHGEGEPLVPDQALKFGSPDLHTAFSHRSRVAQRGPNEKPLELPGLQQQKA